MPTTYDSRSAIETITSPAYTLFVLGNRNRVALNLSGQGTVLANLVLIWSTVPHERGNFLWMSPDDYQSLPYRDWGPLIKEPIYATCGVAFMDALLVETFAVPSSREG